MTSLEIVQYGPSFLFVCGEIDMATAPDLERALAPHLEAGGPVVVDLSAVSFIDSTALRALTNSALKMRTGCLIIHGATGHPSKVLGLVRLADVPNIHVEPCTIDPYPDRPMRFEEGTSKHLAERFQALRAEYQRLRSITESSQQRASGLLALLQETWHSQSAA
jgi:anti-anti-sigma factor